MRITTLITVALVALSVVPTIPAVAKDFKLTDRIQMERSVRFCAPPAELVNVCTKWDKGAPGTFVGKCLQSHNECQTRPVLH